MRYDANTKREKTAKKEKLESKKKKGKHQRKNTRKNGSSAYQRQEHKENNEWMTQ